MPTTLNLLLLFLGATLGDDCSPMPSTSTEARSAWCPSKCPGCAATLLSTTEAEFGSRPSDDGSAGCACSIVEEGISLTGDARIELTAHDDCLVVVGSGQLWASGSDDQDLLRGAGEAERGFLGTRVAPAPALTSSPEPPLETPARVAWYRPHSRVAPTPPHAQGKPPPTCSRRHRGGDLQDALASAPRALPRTQDATAPAAGSRARLRRSVSVVRRSRRCLLL